MGYVSIVIRMIRLNLVAKSLILQEVFKNSSSDAEVMENKLTFVN